MRYKPTKFEIAVLTVVLLAIVSCIPKMVHGEEHPFTRFERNFDRLYSRYGWGDPIEKKAIVKAIWSGSAKNYTSSAYCACIGVMESHYTKVPNPGYLGMKESTCMFQVRRMGLGGKREMWVAYLDRDPMIGTYLGAVHFRYLGGRLKWDVRKVLKSWVRGDGWQKPGEARETAEKYADDVEWLYRTYFVE